jgi:hypothetical protein
MVWRSSDAKVNLSLLRTNARAAVTDGEFAMHPVDDLVDIGVLGRHLWPTLEEGSANVQRSGRA